MDLLFSVKEKKVELFTLVSIQIFWLINLYTLTKGSSLLIYTYLFLDSWENYTTWKNKL